MEIWAIGALQAFLLLFLGILLKSMKGDIHSIRTEVQLGTRQIALLQGEIHQNHAATLKLLHEHEIADMRSFAPVALSEEVRALSDEIIKLKANQQNLAGRRRIND